MEVVEWVLAGEVQQDIVGLINHAGGKAVGLTGRDGGLVRARKLKMIDKDDPSKEHDVGQVGDIVAIDPSVVRALQDDQFIPVIGDRVRRTQRELQHQRRRGGGQAGRGLKAELVLLATHRVCSTRPASCSLTYLPARSTGCSPMARCRAACCQVSSALDAAKAASMQCTCRRRVPCVLLILSDRPTER